MSFHFLPAPMLPFLTVAPWSWNTASPGSPCSVVPGSFPHSHLSLSVHCTDSNHCLLRGNTILQRSAIFVSQVLTLTFTVVPLQFLYLKDLTKNRTSLHITSNAYHFLFAPRTLEIYTLAIFTYAKLCD